MRTLYYHTKILAIMACCLLIVNVGYSQNQIDGKVVSASDGVGLPGVNIIIKGTSSGTVTDSQGQFKIAANPDEVLSISLIGFNSSEILVGNQTTINVTLAESVQQLNDVVVLGYTEKKKSQITGAITNLTADQLKGVTGSSVEYMLQGKVAGVQVSTTSGEPGSVPEIKIRGNSSISAERPPLFVVDGIIGGSYNPNDVESLTVLKDAAAIGLYGSQANAGVIIVTTKRGTTSALQVNYKSTVGSRRKTTGNFKMMNSEEIYDTERKMFNSSATFRSYRPYDTLRETNHDWLNTVYHKATVVNHNLSISQKLDKVSFYVAADYYKEQGTLMQTNYERLNIRANSDYKLSKAVKLTTNLNVISDKNNYPGEWQWTYNPYLYLPYDSPYGPDGSYRYVDGTTTNWYTRDKLNVLHNAEYNKYTVRNFTLNADAILSARITPWLEFQSRNRVSHYTSRNDTYQDARTVEAKAINGEVSFNTVLSSSVISTNLLRFNHDFGADHHLTGFVGFEGSSWTTEDAGAVGIGIPSGLTVPGAASTYTSITGNKIPNHAMSILSEVSYDFKEKYFLSGSFRRDGSSLFGANRHWGNFPAISAAWLISREEFLASVKQISNLKLRASYGIIGNNNIPPFQSLAKYQFAGVKYNGNAAGYPATLPNPNLGWEQTKTVNVGFDLSLFNRIDITVDAFQKNTDQLLLQVQLPISQGFEKVFRNAASIVSKGLEFSISGDVVRAKKFVWNTSFNIGLIRNRVGDLASVGGNNVRLGGDINQVLQSGKGLGSWYMPKWLGVDPANGDPLWEKLTLDADGKVTGRTSTNQYDQAQFQIVGSALPKFFGGFTNTFSYAGFSLSVTTAYQYGNKVYHRTREFVDSDGAYFGFNMMELQKGWTRWQNPGDIATHPKLVANGNQLSNRTSSRYLEDGSFLRVRNITLAYNIPLSIISKYKMTSLRIFISGDNLFTFTKFSGLDPETNSMGNTNYYTIPGVSDFKYPINKQYLAGIQVSF